MTSLTTKLPILALAIATALTFGARPTQAAVIADANADFSGVQGQDNWYYQNWYQPLGYVNSMIFNSGSNQWEDSNGRIFSTGSHPHSTDWRVSQVWVSEVTGTINITGAVFLPSPAAAGVTFQILTNYNIANLVYTQSLAAEEFYTFDVNFDVTTGDSILFSVIGDNGISSDNTIWNAQISQVPEPMTVHLMLGALGLVVLFRRYKKTTARA